jgi:hypothetical protein
MRVSKLLAKSLLAGFVGGLSMMFVACSNETNSVDPGIPSIPGIPADDPENPNPIVLPEDINTLLPNFSYSVYKENGWYVIRLDMTGVQDPYTKDWVQLYGPGNSNQNIWLSIDDMPKGFSISKEEQHSKAVDLVFLVDNSGSMDQEANTLANQVLAWSQKLEASELDMRFGCVGYYGDISGALNITTIDNLNNFLNYSSGTGRTMHFGGADANELRSKTGPYNMGYNECGVAALRFADEQFTFRAGANRVYVDFTDEPNQPNYNSEYSTEWVKDVTNWPTTKGTIHTVYSENNNWTQSINYREYPWNISEYTGGTTLYTNPSFSGVNLDDLPVTGALLNTYIIRFTNIEHLFDGNEHDVHITVKSASPNGEILADKRYSIIFVKP